MPDFLRKAASFVLEHTVSTLFDTGVEKALEQGLHAVFGIKDDTEKILEKLEEVLKGINEVKLAVEELSKKVDVVLYVLRDDAFQGILIEIDTIFISVHSNMIKAREYAKKKGEPGTDKAVAHLQNELDGILKEGIAKIPNVLNKAHYYLGSSGKNSFVQQSVQHAFDESNNIIAYYSRAKTQAMRYWSYTIKGLVLLHMAEKTESVDWLGGSDLIKTFENQFREQEKLLRSTIGENTCELVEMFFTKPEWQRPVRFLVEWGIVIEMHPLAHNQSELQAKGDYKPFPWNLNPARWDADNNIQIQSLEGDWGPFADHRLLFTAKDMEISGALAPNRSAPIDRWALVCDFYCEIYYVKPVEAGSERYRISRGKNGGYLYLGWDRHTDANLLGFDEKLVDKQKGDGHGRARLAVFLRARVLCNTRVVTRLSLFLRNFFFQSNTFQT